MTPAPAPPLEEQAEVAEGGWPTPPALCEVAEALEALGLAACPVERVARRADGVLVVYLVPLAEPVVLAESPAHAKARSHPGEGPA